ncbi:MAG: hypothetical protein MJZ65_00830 [Paludibacteraceae bacterium]|nr:hypothetical protein [Paludibacteraceae bacterium]
MKKILTILPTLLFAGGLIAAGEGTTENHNLGTQCTDEEGQVTMTATTDGDYYVWYEGDTKLPYTQKSITLDRQSGTHTYRVETYKTTIDVSHDLMTNGGFENGNSGFTSSYQYFQDNQTGTFYLDGHENANNLYTITSNAQGFWRDFQHISPHSGSKYALFDAGQGGYAWRTNTDLNPNLTLVKDSSYAFSFWVACPNPEQYFNKPAVLQFKICWKNAEGVLQPEVNLGPSYTTTYTTGTSWVQVSASWVAPVDASWVQIGVYDSSTESQGNDFCLDDIVFQQVTILTNQVTKTDIYTYVGEKCHCYGEDMYRKWSDVVFVPNTDNANPYVSYQWYVDGEPVQGATAQYCRFSAEQLSKEVYATMVCKDGTEKYTCPTKITDIPAAVAQSAPQRQVLERRVYPIGAGFQVIQTFYNDGTNEIQKEILH